MNIILEALRKLNEAQDAAESECDWDPDGLDDEVSDEGVAYDANGLDDFGYTREQNKAARKFMRIKDNATLKDVDDVLSAFYDAEEEKESGDGFYFISEKVRDSVLDILLEKFNQKDPDLMQILNQFVTKFKAKIDKADAYSLSCATRYKQRFEELQEYAKDPNHDEAKLCPDLKDFAFRLKRQIFNITSDEQRIYNYNGRDISTGYSPALRAFIMDNLWVYPEDDFDINDMESDYYNHYAERHRTLCLIQSVVQDWLRRFE